MRAEAFLLLQIGGVHILRAVRNEIDHSHKQDEIGKARPITKDGATIGSPIGARPFPGLGFRYFCTDEEREQRRQSADEKHGPPAPVRKDKTVSARSQQKS